MLSSLRPISDEILRKSIDAHRASFTALKTSLGAAKLELWDYRIQRTMTNYDQIVASMNRLAQHLTGVRSAVIMERELDVFRDQQAHERKRSQLGSEIDTEQKMGTEGDNDIMATFQQHVGPSLRTLGASRPWHSGAGRCSAVLILFIFCRLRSDSRSVMCAHHSYSPERARRAVLLRNQAMSKRTPMDLVVQEPPLAMTVWSA